MKKVVAVKSLDFSFCKNPFIHYTQYPYASLEVVELKKLLHWQGNCGQTLEFVMFVFGMLLLRAVLAGWLLPDGRMLEDVVQVIQSGEVPMQQVVADFCQELVMDGPY